MSEKIQIAQSNKNILTIFKQMWVVVTYREYEQVEMRLFESLEEARTCWTKIVYEDNQEAHRGSDNIDQDNMYAVIGDGMYHIYTQALVQNNNNKEISSLPFSDFKSLTEEQKLYIIKFTPKITE
jgi:hypothetical protein